MYLIVSAACMAVYFADVVLGAYQSASFLSGVGQFFTLLIATIFFVVSILRAERKAREAGEKPEPNPSDPVSPP